MLLPFLRKKKQKAECVRWGAGAGGGGAGGGGRGGAGAGETQI